MRARREGADATMHVLIMTLWMIETKDDNDSGG